jgi:hypothetical protein
MAVALGADDGGRFEVGRPIGRAIQVVGVTVDVRKPIALRQANVHRHSLPAVAFSRLLRSPDWVSRDGLEPTTS